MLACNQREERHRRGTAAGVLISLAPFREGFSSETNADQIVEIARTSLVLGEPRQKLSIENDCILCCIIDLSML